MGAITPRGRLSSKVDGNFRFLAAACRWPDNTARRAAILAAATHVDDWNVVVEHGKHHRVMPLVANALQIAECVPPELVARARQVALRNAFAAISQASEVVRIGSAFDAEGIDWLTFKGPALAMVAYRTLCIKASHDIDLLVDRRSIDKCFAIMTALGYVRAREPASAAPDKIELHYKDYIWIRTSDGIRVELHTRFFDTASLVPGLDLRCPRELVTLAPAHSVPTLARPELLVYLAAHGARTSWHRIKWLADFAALCGESEPSDIIAAHRRAADARLEEVFDSAQLLCGELFNTPTPRAHLTPRLQRRARRLANVAMRELTSPHTRTRRFAGRPTRLGAYLEPIRVTRSWAYRYGELKRLLSDPRAVAHGEIAGGWRGWINPAVLVSRLALRQLARLMPMRR